MIRVIAPSRLHFGLFHVPVGRRSAAGRARVRRRRADDRDARAWSSPPSPPTRGSSRGRSRAGRRRSRCGSCMSLPETERRPFQVLVEQCPDGAHRPRRRHATRARGGEGTRGRARARRISRRSNSRRASAAASVPRSAFTASIAAGLLVEAGKLAGEECVAARRSRRAAAPRGAWCCSARRLPPWHGDRERAAFASADRGRPGRAAETSPRPRFSPPRSPATSTRSARRSTSSTGGPASRSPRRRAGRTRRRPSRS